MRNIVIATEENPTGKYAPDCLYVLRYWPNGCFWRKDIHYTAGCRQFKTKAEAVKHWQKRHTELEGHGEINSEFVNTITKENLARAKQFLTALKAFRVPR